MGDGPPPDDFDYGEQQEDGQYENYPTIEEGEFVQEPRRSYIHDEVEGGCGTRTRMSTDLMNSVARDPQGYSHTYCAGCEDHVPVSEVRWVKDGEPWVVEE